MAVTLVVAFHVGLPLPGGFVGVDVFFVISGFVIAALILRQLDQSRFSFTQFFARRAKRLTPALALMIVSVFILSLLFQSPLGEQQVTAQTGVGALFLVANLVILRTTGSYFDAAAEANPLLHTWSLSVEEQFYLVFPLLVFLVAARMSATRQRTRSLIAVIAGIALASFVINALLSFGIVGQSWTSQPEAWAFYLPVTRAWEFAAGALVAVWWHGRTREEVSGRKLGRVGSSTLGIIGVLLIVASAVLITDSIAFPGFVALIPVTGTVLVIIAGGISGNAISRFLSTRPMTSLGDMSYSVYLWHWPLVVFAVALWPSPWTAIIAAAFSFVPAYLAYRLVEQPIRTSGVNSPRVIFASYVAATAVIVGLAWGLVTLGTKAVPYAATASEATMGIESGCLIADRAFDESDIERCRFAVSDAKGWILLAGDSHAESFSNAVIEAGNSLGYDVVAVTGADCVMVRGNQANARVSNCAEMAETVLDKATGLDGPAAVVLAQRGIPVGMRNTLEELSSSGVPVLWIEEIPQWRRWDAKQGPDPCAGGLVNSSCELPREQVIANASASKPDEASVVGGLPNITTFDPWSMFCTEQSCSAILNGEVAYSDASHLNAFGSQAFLADIRKELSTMLVSP